MKQFLSGYQIRTLFRLCIILYAILLIISPGMAEDGGNTLVAIYASGGTLEQESGLITDDFSQIIQGAGNNSSDRISIVVAYGGADKPGWQGMTIADEEELRRDLLDGELGSHNASSLHIPDANMGDPESLTLFLSFIHENYQFDRIFLIFIGHGQAYTGMLFDQNHGDDGLTIEDLAHSFAEGPWDLDLIGFDSCLMGCLEVLSALSPYAAHIIASEESIPAEGWPYESWIAYLTSHPDAPLEEYAQILFDEYMKNPGYGKTIALLDPKEADFLTARLDRFAKDLHALSGTDDGCTIIREVLTDTQQFGLTGTGELEEATMDLYSFAETTGKKVPYLAESSGEVIEGINRIVIFAKHDERVPGAHGVAILSPVLINPVFYEYYRESAFITPSWDRFMAAYLETCLQENGESIPFSHEKENES